MTTILPYAARALPHLRRKDPALRPLFRRVGPFVMPVEPNRFAALVYSIVGQQLSVLAAATIRKRLLESLSGKPLSPRALLALPTATLRGAGLSRAKTEYLQDLADRVRSGAVDLDALHEGDDEAVIAALTQVRGIGRWTAEMFLIFSLGRPDVLPVDDLGLRAGIQRLDGLKELPSKADVRLRGEKWRPYRTVATWYCWQGLKIKDES
jgi:DNA-3-methyladenine glycosylase II